MTVQSVVSRLLQRLGLSDDAVVSTVCDDLAAHYSAPDRHYHTLDHIDGMLHFVEERWAATAAEVGQVDLDALELAVLYHDVVYDSRAPRGENEEASADHAERMLALLADRGAVVPDSLLDAVRDLILTTVDHTPDRAAPYWPSAALLADADLAHFAAPWERFLAQTEQVRREYDWVPDDAWRVGRRDVLLQYLLRNPLYYVARELDAPATLNLVRYLREYA